MRSQSREEQGFTLIELLVVIIIIGILSAIAIPTFLKQREKGWRTAAASDMKNAATAVETYSTEQDGSFLGANGLTQDSPILRSEGFNPTNFVSLVVSATVESYCITGITVRLPDKVFQFRSTTGVVDVSDGVAPPC